MYTIRPIGAAVLIAGAATAIYIFRTSVQDDPTKHRKRPMSKGTSTGFFGTRRPPAVLSLDPPANLVPVAGS
jgi:hypothetical protein